MTTREQEKSWAAEIFGRDQSANNLGRKATATIYHSVFLHSPIRDAELLAGIRRNLEKLLTPEEFKKVEHEHSLLGEHSLHGKTKI